MIDKAQELRAAAQAIDSDSLRQAKTAVSVACEEYLRWADLFIRRLETVEPSELHRFARAFSLTLLGHLPTRPETCPFCIQYGRDRSCQGCGYARTHGRCDADSSSFSLFIEAFQDLGRVIYQDTSIPSIDEAQAKRMLQISISSSAKVARRMMEDLPSATTMELMALKAAYLAEMLGLLPVVLLSVEVQEHLAQVLEVLRNYW
jgi:hypothetical protein